MVIYRMYRKVVMAIAAPLYISYFFDKDVGREYGLGILDKIKIIIKFRRNIKRIPSATTWLEHLRIAAEILKIPSIVSGDVIECGCYKGGSSTNLSLICDIVGRKLVLCDSFEGLPTPGAADKFHCNIVKKRVRLYEKGDYTGVLDEVKQNISRFGKIDVCEFVKGYYSDTFKELAGSYVLAFVDVDLHKSIRECLAYLWPRLIKGAYLFSHEAQDLSFVALFFDEKWWKENLDCAPPGLIGAGAGLPLGMGQGSGLGYAIKLDMGLDTKEWASISYGKE